jgi:3-mercaptopyruvate sulfurtransferase SseA
MIIDCRRITIINKSIDMVFLDKIADVKSGLTTGDNKYYVYKSRHVEGSYKIVDHNNVLNDDEISKIRSNEKIRSILAHKGINKNMFNGKTIVPYDKGGFSDIESGRLNNY